MLQLVSIGLEFGGSRFARSGLPIRRWRVQVPLPPRNLKFSLGVFYYVVLNKHGQNRDFFGFPVLLCVKMCFYLVESGAIRPQSILFPDGSWVIVAPVAAG